MNKVVIATKNKGKVKEIKDILSELPVEVVSMQDEGIEIDIVEDGSSFEENALIKARTVGQYTSAIIIADDSGLEVDCLGGAPGIYSSRFAGEGANDEKNNAKLLAMLEGVEEAERTARFVCAIAVVMPDNEHFVVRGECEGTIGFEPKGQHGFGYDPLFYIPEYDAAMAQLEPEVKNRISHRARALEKMKNRILYFLRNEPT